MLKPVPSSAFASSESHSLGIYQPPMNDANVAFWRINGYRATIMIWTPEEWDRLTDHPPDAQLFPSGIWCAMRME